MADDPMRIVLTPEQREAIHRASGRHVEMIEIEPAEAKKPSGVLKFAWRLSAASGIPRQAWMKEDPPANKK